MDRAQRIFEELGAGGRCGRRPGSVSCLAASGGAGGPLWHAPGCYRAAGGGPA